MRRVGGFETGLDEVSDLWLFDERAELGGGNIVNVAGFRNSQQKDLSSGQRTKLERFLQDATPALAECDLAAISILDELNRNLAATRVGVLCIMGRGRVRRRH